MYKRQDIESLTYLAWAAAMIGDTNAALVFAERAVDMDPADPYSHYYDGLVRLQAGDPERAIDALEQAAKSGYPVAMLSADPILKDIRDDRRFARLLVGTNN